MATLKILNVKVLDSKTISITFTDSLTTNLIASNISIKSDVDNVPDSEVLKLSVSGATVRLTCLPLSALSYYYIELHSLTNYPFKSLNGDAFISEDGISNRYYFIAPLEPENPVKNYLDSFFHGNIYNTTDDTTVISKYIKSIAKSFSRALYDIRQAGNENYLSFNVIDEIKTRGEGPFDRLDEEGAYHLIRLGLGPTGSTVSAKISYDPFPAYPITLQRESFTETLSINSIDIDGVFNINNFILNLSNSPVSRVNSITFTLNTINPVYEYDITKYGYQILDSRYDQDYGFTYLQLENNQIRLSDKILEDPLFELDKILKIDVEYEFKNLGVVVDESSVEVYTVEDVSREVLPPIINIFSLGHAPIVDISNNIPTTGGVTFIDPNTNTGSSHPAFKYEIPFRLSALPATPGQYAIDYNTGTVYVYGADITNDGTGPYPPLAIYKYRLTYQSEIDYVYDPDFLDIVSLPHGSLRYYDGTIGFNYEVVLTPDVDYKISLHQEELQERIENRLVGLNVIKTVNSPITNVFRIYNESTGEIYSLDRWNDDKIYFRYSDPPRIFNKQNERVSFKQIPNELLFVENTLTNVGTLRIFRINLNNNTLVSSTEDSLGSSFNSSVVFSNANVFGIEKWFNPDYDPTVNIDRLENIGEYMVDYNNGVVYCAVSSTQDFNIGSVTYRHNNIVPEFTHVLAVDDLYYRLSPLDYKNKTFEAISFGEASIIPEYLDPSSELYFNDTETSPYQIFDKEVGSFIEASFVAGVTHPVKGVRHVYEFIDLLNSTNPINFAFVAEGENFNITVPSITKQFYDTVQYNVTDGYYVLINENIPYLSPNITFTFSVIRTLDSAQLWDGGGTIVPGNPLKLILSGVNSPLEGDQITVDYTFTINSLSRVVVDYNKGDYFVDYTYLADEIIISYEYGDNVIDFRESANISAGTNYYASYKVGALRDALLKNFGTLVNIPELATFNIDFNRERYRDALSAALTSFIQGPTITALKNIGKTISHIDPEIKEYAFINWSLGNSLLYPEEIETTGSFELLPTKYGNGALINSEEQTVKLPMSSNLRLEEGTFETWISGHWNGIDNDAILTFNILKDGAVIPENEIFIGPGEQHPTIENGEFTLDKNSNVAGTPNFSKDGIFIYYDKDASQVFSRWYVKVVDGYVDPTNATYKIKITSTGSFYDNKSINIPKPSNLNTFTGSKTLTINLTGSGGIEEGVTFVSDIDHYILDYGEEKTKNRISIYKDISGYMNFRVYDNRKNSYTVSADVSSWNLDDMHHVAASWKLNTFNGQDELHLFIDGFEVPNIIKYGQKLQPYLHEKFRTIDPEEVAGLADRDIVGSVDLQTVAGSAQVSSSINFSAYNIFAGDTIFIDEVGFDSAGYTISSVSGQNLILNTPMPVTITNGTFSINRTEYIITSEIDIAPNITVSTIHTLLTGSDMDGYMSTNTVTSSSVDFESLGVLPGYFVSIDDPNLPLFYTILDVDGYTLTIDDTLPIDFSATDFQIYDNTENEIPGVRAIRPSYSISKDGYFNNILTVSNNVYANDLILVKTLGLNFRNVKKKYYVWSDDQENVLMTQLPSPISLDEAKITKITVPSTGIGPSNSTLMAGIFYSNNLPGTPVSNSEIGRTISITLGGNNTDFSTPVAVTINGLSGVAIVNETIYFDDYGTKDFANHYLTVNYINVAVKPINDTRTALTVEAREKYSITHSESSGLVPVVKYSYSLGGGSKLYDDGYGIVRDDEFLFSHLDTNNYLVIHSPISVAGFYLITGISEDRHSLYIQPTSQATQLPLPSFTNGIYQVLNVTSARTGLQNGFFTFEAKLLPSQAYFLDHGFYELNYATYTRIKVDPSAKYMYLGSDFNGEHQLNGLINYVKIYSTMLADTRVGETVAANERSITKDYNALKPWPVDANTLALITFNSFPFTNDTDIYITQNDVKKHFLSSHSINENFNNSVAVLNEPIILENNGLLDTTKQGTIEFWMNPLFDTNNDPNDRFYFDAFGAVIEEAVSVDDASVKISAPASKILSVKLKAGDPRIDYFSGGRIEIDTQRGIQEVLDSTSTSTVTVSSPILQVISVKIVGDLTGTDYFAGGVIGTDNKTIYLSKTLPSSPLQLLVTYQTTENKNVTLNTQVIRLHKKLPYQKSNVIVTYLPEGIQGDRISIFKDKAGYMNFGITASGTDYVVRGPTYWPKNTWHRVKASYKINGAVGQNELRLFLDGYEYVDIVYGESLIYGYASVIWGMSYPGSYQDGYGFLETIKFKDPINTLYIGSQYTQESPIYSLIDNFRISNVSRPIYTFNGESIDVNYSPNLNTVYPVTPDLYTTYLMNFDKMVTLNEDFALLKNRSTGLFDFSINILDSFGIVNDNIKSQEALEAIIKILKPANSRVFIQYIR